MYEKEYRGKTRLMRGTEEQLTNASKARGLIDHIPSFSEDPENILRTLRSLDAFIVFEGNTVLKASSAPDAALRIKPTSFRDGDDFGPLGGRHRTLAAGIIGATLGADSPQPVFVGGNPDKKLLSHDVAHSGAEIYEANYQETIEKIRASAAPDSPQKPRTRSVAKTFPAPALILDQSENSYGDIEHALKTATERGWTKLGFLSNQYHLPRLQKLFELARKNNAPQFDTIEVTLLGAEDIIVSLSSDVMRARYEPILIEAYTEPGMLSRIAQEKKGISDIKSGSYAPGSSKSTSSGK